MGGKGSAQFPEEIHSPGQKHACHAQSAGDPRMFGIVGPKNLHGNLSWFERVDLLKVENGQGFSLMPQRDLRAFCQLVCLLLGRL